MLFAALLIYAALLVLPDYFQAVIPGLDASWSFALNHFVHTNYKFGPDLIFTYGPLGFLSVPQHVSWNLPVALVVRFAIWALLFSEFIGMWRAGQHLAAFALVSSLCLGNKLYFYYWDYLLIFTAIVLLARMMQAPGSYLRPAVLCVLLGIAFLLRPTAFILMVLLAALYAVHRFLSSERTLASSERLLLAAFIFAGPIAYLFYNPSLSGLLAYIKGTLEISSGFAAAMSLDTASHDASLLTATCLLMAISLVFAAWTRALPFTAALMVLASAWVSFRHGFVRSDSGHVADFFAFDIAVFAFFLALLRKTALRAAYLCSFAVFSLLALDGVADRWSPLSPSYWSPGLNLANAHALLSWSKEMTFLDHAPDPLFQTLPVTSFTSQIKRARLLMFPSDISSAAHQSVDIVPLYVLQAYSAHTRYLDQTSALHIQSAANPIDHVVLQWSDIDSRNELLDAPATWMSLFANFAPESETPEALLLERRPVALDLAYIPLTSEEYQAGVWVPVPQRSTPVAMSIDLRPTAYGSFLTSTYKLAPVVLELRTASGKLQSIRVTADVLSSPSFINCLPLSFPSLSELWSANHVKDPIISLRLTGRGLKHLKPSPYHFFDVEGTPVTVANVAPPPR